MRRRRRRLTSGLNKRAPSLGAGRSGSGFVQALKSAGAFLLRVIMLPVTLVQWIAGKLSGNKKHTGTGAFSAEGGAVKKEKSKKIGLSGRDGAEWLIKGGSSAGQTLLDVALCAMMLLALGFAGYTVYTADNSVPVTVSVDGQTRSIYTKTATVEALLSEQGVTLAEGDTLNVALADPIEEQMEVVVTRAFPVAVASGGEVEIVYMQNGTVAQALDEVGVTYDSDDRLSQLSYADVEPGMSIQHTSVETRYETVEKAIEYNEEVVKDSSKYEDYAEITTAGEDGLRRVVRQLVYEEGELISREVMDSIVLKEAIDEIKVVGTKIRYQTNYEGEWRRAKDKPVAGKNGWVEMTVYRVTAYCTGSRTATGTRPKLGTIAVNPNLIPYGTQIWIKGYGYGTAQDTGKFRNYPEPRNNAVDIWLNTEKEARRWGSKYNMTILVKMG